MLATIIVGTMVVVPLVMTLVQVFRRPGPPIAPESLPRYSMRDFKDLKR